jgi:glycogen operon protein
MGDEVRHTQRGNNNAYCQDNEISWFDWTRVARHADVHRFVTLLCARRGLRNFEGERQRVSITSMLRDAKKAWHGVKLNEPDWGDSSRSFAFGAELQRTGLLFHFILNAYSETLDFELPPLARGTWKRWIDTGLDSPDDISPWAQAPAVTGRTYSVVDHSVVLLLASIEGATS